MPSNTATPATTGASPTGSKPAAPSKTSAANPNSAASKKTKPEAKKRDPAVVKHLQEMLTATKAQAAKEQNTSVKEDLNNQVELLKYTIDQARSLPTKTQDQIDKQHQKGLMQGLSMMSKRGLLMGLLCLIIHAASHNKAKAQLKGQKDSGAMLDGAHSNAKEAYQASMKADAYAERAGHVANQMHDNLESAEESLDSAKERLTQEKQALEQDPSNPALQESVSDAQLNVDLAQQQFDTHQQAYKEANQASKQAKSSAEKAHKSSAKASHNYAKAVEQASKGNYSESKYHANAAKRNASDANRHSKSAEHALKKTNPEPTYQAGREKQRDIVVSHRQTQVQQQQKAAARQQKVAAAQAKAQAKAVKAQQKTMKASAKTHANTVKQPHKPAVHSNKTSAHSQPVIAQRVQPVGYAQSGPTDEKLPMATVHRSSSDPAARKGTVASSPSSQRIGDPAMQKTQRNSRLTSSRSSAPQQPQATRTVKA